MRLAKVQFNSDDPAVVEVTDMSASGRCLKAVKDELRGTHERT